MAEEKFCLWTYKKQECDNKYNSKNPSNEKGYRITDD